MELDDVIRRFHGNRIWKLLDRLNLANFTLDQARIICVRD